MGSADYKTLAEAASYTGRERSFLIDELLSGSLRAGVDSMAWHGCAMQVNELGKLLPSEWENPKSPKGDSSPIRNVFWRRASADPAQLSNQDTRVIVMSACVMRFWFLDRFELELILQARDSGANIRWLIPERGEWWHEQHPHAFPWPMFMFRLYPQEDQHSDVSLRITADRLILRTVDLDPFKSSSAPREIATSRRVDEQRVEMILKAIADRGWPPLSIPDKGKSELRKEFRDERPLRLPESAFDRAWKYGCSHGLVKMASYDKPQ